MHKRVCEAVVVAVVNERLEAIHDEKDLIVQTPWHMKKNADEVEIVVKISFVRADQQPMFLAVLHMFKLPFPRLMCRANLNTRMA